MLIFLDIDGVMVPAKSWVAPELLHDGFPKFSSSAISVLQELLFDDVRIVLTTSHRDRFTIDEWREVFKARNLNIQNLESLPVFKIGEIRKTEVLNYLKSNGIQDDFIIIDDDKSLNDLPDLYKRKLVLTSPMIGLVADHLIEINQKISVKNLV